MNFTKFRSQYRDRPYFLGRDITHGQEGVQNIRNQLRRWQQRGLITALKKSLYVFNRDDGKAGIDKNYAANVIYGPSYLSLEYALSFYGLVPERVTDITCVTTLKTAVFDNPLGRYVYQHIKPEAFRGFISMGEFPSRFFMAGPEKAVVDFLYLNLGKFKGNTVELLKESYRFQNVEDLDQAKLSAWGKLFKVKKLTGVIRDFCRWIDEEQHD